MISWDTGCFNRAVKSHKMARGSKFRIKEVEVSVQLKSAFVFAYAKRFSHDATHTTQGTQ